MDVNEYLSQELERAGYGTIEIQKTPMGHRVIVQAVRLGMIIGKRGRNIRRLTQELEEDFGLESPQLEVHDLENPELVARVMASRLISQIQRGFHFRRAGYSMLRRIMANGARGCEIIINGKLTSQRARRETFRAGFVAKCGEPAERFVDNSVLSTTMKQGVIGVHVRIMLPDSQLPDEPIFYENPFPEDVELEKRDISVDEDEYPLDEEEGVIEAIESISDIEEEDIVADTEQIMELDEEDLESLEEAEEPIEADEVEEVEEVEEADDTEVVEDDEETEEVEEAEDVEDTEVAKEEETEDIEETEEPIKEEDKVRSPLPPSADDESKA